MNLESTLKDDFFRPLATTIVPGALAVAPYILIAACYISGVKKFWDDETRTWSKRGLPNPHEVTFTKVGGWDAILYDIPIPDATNSHLRAHWVAAGTWIDVHLSTTGTGTRADSRAALLRELKTFHVEEKN